MSFKKGFSPALAACVFNPSTREAKAGGSLELEISLVYTASSKKPCHEKQKTNKKPAKQKIYWLLNFVHMSVLS